MSVRLFLNEDEQQDIRNAWDAEDIFALPEACLKTVRDTCEDLPDFDDVIASESLRWAIGLLVGAFDRDDGVDAFIAAFEATVLNKLSEFKP